MTASRPKSSHGSETAKTREEADKQLEEVIARIAAKQAIGELERKLEEAGAEIKSYRQLLADRRLASSSTRR